MAAIRRAIVSVYDKTGIEDFARALAQRGVELLSTGGTARALRAAGLEVKDISEHTGFPEMLDGRVKTLHPKIHGGLLFRRDDPAHVAACREHGIEPIDLLCVNLYPFEETVARPGITIEEAIEQIDIGGPAMIRSAAKNHQDVTVLVDPTDYEAVLAEMDAHEGATTPGLRRRLAAKVFARAAAYNAAIAAWMTGFDPETEATPPLVIVSGPGRTLRYGENPHQAAAFHADPAGDDFGIAQAEVLHGKEMSFNNYVDGDAALEAVRDLSGEPGVAIIKHTNPCGYATGPTLAEAFEAAWAGDPVSAFGSVIAVTQTVDTALAGALKGRFVEALIAPDFEPAALEQLRAGSRNLRLLRLTGPLTELSPGKTYRQIHGGWLSQDRDRALIKEWNCVTRAPFPDALRPLAEFACKACKHVKSNAIVLARTWSPGYFSVLGMGAGQPNRVDAVRKLALTKARENIALLAPADSGNEEAARRILGECVLASDAFFPFADNIENAAAAGIRYIVQPGGSLRDQEVIEACDAHGIAMVCTGLRHFKH